MKKTALFLALILVVCSTSAYALTKGISISGWQYDPANLTIGAGMTVVWTNNEDTSTHRVNLRELSKASDLLFPGESFSFTFDKPGKYSFYDSASPVKLKGTINVVPTEEYTYCGDGICNEDKASCCKDCSCDAGYYCFNNVCVEEKAAQDKQNEITGLTAREDQPEEPEEPIEETIPTNYAPLKSGSMIVGIIIAAFLVVAVAGRFVKKR